MVLCLKLAHNLLLPVTQTNPVLGISFCMMIIRLQLRDKNTVIGSDTPRQSYVDNFKTASKEHSSQSDSSNMPHEPMVFSPKRTVDSSTFDATISKV